MKNLLLLLSLFLLTACSESTDSDSTPEDNDVKKISFTGFVKSKHIEKISPPSGYDWQYKVTQLAEEGSRVKKGDLVATLEGERIKKWQREEENSLESRKIELEKKLANIETQIDTLKVSIADAEKEVSILKTAQSSTLSKEAREWLVSERKLTIDKLDLQSKELDLQLKKEKLSRKIKLHDASKKSKVTSMEIFDTVLAGYKKTLEASKRYTTSGGIIVYGLVRRKDKPKVGGVVYKGSTVMSIVDDKNIYIESYLKEMDWLKVSVGAEVQVRILGRREEEVDGRISKISKVVMKVSDWDPELPPKHDLYETRAFKVEIELESTPSGAKHNGEVEVAFKPKKSEEPKGAG